MAEDELPLEQFDLVFRHLVNGRVKYPVRNGKSPVKSVLGPPRTLLRPARFALFAAQSPRSSRKAPDMYPYERRNSLPTKPAR